jgi:hypothetical protein
VSAIVFQKEVCSEELQVQNTYQQKFRVPILILFILSTKIIIIFSFSFIRKIKYFDSAGYMSYREMITKPKKAEIVRITLIKQSEDRTFLFYDDKKNFLN